ncbi:MAG: hypothetical protein FJW96_13870 [Actinobacteria bacterium]|nr:hypothetical protein [Actinomycetota bacterium]
MDELVIYCADVGSVPKGNFGWARSGIEGKVEFHDGGTEIVDLVSAVARDIERGCPVALGFECPLFVPVPQNPLRLGAKRAGEPIAFSASAASGALVTGVIQVAWVLRELHGILGPIPVFQDWHEFVEARGGLFLWEALVSGAAKAGTHMDDAVAAVAAFRQALPDPEVRNAVEVEGDVLSLVSAALIWAGWPAVRSDLRTPCIVVAAVAGPGHV